MGICVVYCSMNKRDWTITFNDGSTATYFNMSSLAAVNTAVNDWIDAHRRTVAERGELQIDTRSVTGG